jgi:hypothetical protein
MKWLEGKKTYMAAAVGVAVALGGAYFGVVSNDAAAEILVGSLALVGIRSAFAKLIAGQAVRRAAEEGKKRRESIEP